jgi:hypothetical protein
MTTFVLVDGVKIAKRGGPDTALAMTWIATRRMHDVPPGCAYRMSLIADLAPLVRRRPPGASPDIIDRIDWACGRGVLREMVIGVECPPEHLAGDALGYVP